METFTTEFSIWTFKDKDGKVIGSDAKEEVIHSFSSPGTEGVQCEILVLPDQQGGKCTTAGPKHCRYEIMCDFAGKRMDSSPESVSYFCESSGSCVSLTANTSWVKDDSTLTPEEYSITPESRNVRISQKSLETIRKLAQESKLKLQLSASRALNAQQKCLYNSIKAADVDFAKIARAMRASVNGYDIELVAGCEDTDDEDSDSTRVPVHKAILLGHQFFEDMLNSGMEESVLLSTSSSTNENEGISLKGDGSTYPGSQKKILPSIKLEMELSTLKAFVNCMYGEEIEFTLDHLGDKPSVESNLCDSRKAWIAGEKYGLDRLRGLAGRHIASKLSIDTVLGDLVLSKEVVSPALSDIYLAYASMHYQKVLESKSFGKVFRELATGTYPAASGDLFSKFILSKGEFTPSPSPSTCYKRNHQSERK